MFRKNSRLKTITVRRPTVRTPGQPSLISLSEDVLAIIVDLLAYTSPAVLPRLALVNTLLYLLTRTGLQRHICFGLLTEDQCAGTVRRCIFLEMHQLCPAVRELVIDDRWQNKCSVYRKGLEAIRRILPKLTGLRTLDYKGDAIPAEFLKVIADQPGVQISAILPKLEAYGPAGGATEANSNFTRLLGNVQLRILSVAVYYWSAEDCLATMRPLKRFLVSTPNLRVLNLNVEPASCASDTGHVGRFYAGLGFLPGEKLPVLEELSLKNYPFAREPERLDNPCWGTIGYPGIVPEIDFWAENMDCSLMRKLHTPFAELVSKITPKLTALADLACETASQTWSMPGKGTADDVAMCLRGVPSALTSITLSTLPTEHLDGILRHAGTLRKLYVHQPEARRSSWEPQVSWKDGTIALESLAAIQSACTGITDLNINLYRQDEWPYDTFEVLSRFANLQRLGLWFELGLTQGEPPVSPRLDRAAAETIMTCISQGHGHAQSQLQQVKLYTETPPEAIRVGWPSLYPYKADSFVCSVSNKPENADAGTFKIARPHSKYEDEDFRRERRATEFRTGSVSWEPSTSRIRFRGLTRFLLSGRLRLEKGRAKS